MTAAGSGAFGLRPVINACGIYTDLGGSRLSPTVWAAMEAANRHFVGMPGLLEAAGDAIAGQLGAEAGTITPGAAASIALMAAAAMTGLDGSAGERLPEPAGSGREIVLQRNHRYKYDRQARLTGATLVTAGTQRGTTGAELEAVLGPRTAAVLFPAHLEGQAGTLSLAEVSALCRRHAVPLLVDAAYLCWPLERFPAIVAAGADLMCASAKYFGGPNAGGFIVGTRAMIAAVRANDFTGYESGEYRTFGRPFKMDRQTIVGVVTAFEEWLTADHAARWAGYRMLAGRLLRRIAGRPGVAARPAHFTMDERVIPEPVNAVEVRLAPERAARIAESLAAGDPSILCIRDGAVLVFCFDTIDPPEAELLGDRLTCLLDQEPHP